MAAALPQGVVEMMGARTHRIHHYLWHEVRNGWLSYDAATQAAITALGWAPPRPAREAGPGPVILDNASGEDFLFMHRDMIAGVNAKLAQIGDPAYPKVEGWSPIPGPADADWPVPAPYSLGDPGFDAFITEIKGDDFFNGAFSTLAAQYRDPAILSSISLGELGARIEFTTHNNMHMRWSGAPAVGPRPDSDPTAPDAIDTQWDDLAYNWLGDTYSSHVNPVFWKLHGWVDGCIDAWMAANGLTGEPDWTGTWIGPTPMHGPEAFFALSPEHGSGHGHGHGGGHGGHDDPLVKMLKLVRDSGVSCHFYDKVEVPPLP